MMKTEEEQKLEDEANKYNYMNQVIDNLKVKQQNGRLWTPYHDMQLYEYVIKYNFNFYEISNAFQRLCTNEKKYEYSEDAVRLHWAFLHAMRNFGQTPDESYYQRMKLQYDKEKPKTFKTTVEEKEKVLSEEEDIRRMKIEFERMMKEKEEKEKKIQEEKMQKEKERIEMEKKENEEVEKLISSTKRKDDNDEEEENEENEKEEEKKEEKKEEIKEIKEYKVETKKNNKLYDEENEPEYIKQLFSKKIPQEILDKLNKDKEKYNHIENNQNSNNEKSKENEENKEEIKTNEKSIIGASEKKPTNEVEENEKEIENINSNLDINKEIQKKENEKKTSQNINKEEEEDLFPIKSNKQKDFAEPGKFENVNMEQELQNTQDFNDYIQSNPVLKKQYEQLNNYCNFAVKSINYIVKKGAGVDNTSESEAKKIEQTNRKLNEFLLEPIIRKTEEEGFSLEDWNKKIEEEEHKMTFETTNYDNYMKNAPQDEERDMKLNKFKEHLFGFADKISTEELLEKITGIINQNNDDQEDNNNSDNNNNNNNSDNNNNGINLENRIQNFMNDLENHNVEDEKSENTKEQSESITDNNNIEDNGRNTISSIGSIEVPRRYRHVYRGMVYYNDKPDENDKKNQNKRSNRINKKKKDEDDEIEEDDDDDDEDYNK